ncbi:MAG: hypothetical protein J6T55_03785 [Alphaproteobacteria bacterium]|nr:hypothetical protein [Alphaproteobacteria bacterium]
MFNGRCALTTAGCAAKYPTTGGFRDDDGWCHSCPYSNGIITTKDECDKCGTLRYMDGNYCKKK